MNDIAYNTITAVFPSDEISIRVYSEIWQWDYGQILRIQGLSLDTATEVHFAHEGDTESITRLGVTRDGITDVPVPDSILEQSGTFYAYVYVTDKEFGQTEYKITFTIRERAKPQPFNIPEDAELFRDAVKAVNESADRAEASERAAGEAAIQADASKADAERSAKHAAFAAQAAENSEKISSQAAKQSEAALSDVEHLQGMVNSDALAVEEDRAEVEALSIQVTADREQTGRDAEAAKADRLQTNIDRQAVAADRAATEAARNTAVEKANLAVNKAEETEADKQSTETNKAATQADKEATEANVAESERILQEQIQMLGMVPMIYAVTILEELQAYQGAKEGDFGIIQEPRAMLFRYYTKDINGNDLNPPAWQWMTDLNITFTREALLNTMKLADIATSGSFNDLQDIPNRYNAPLVLDGTAEIIEWEYSQSDTAVVTLTEQKVLDIQNAYNGAVAVVQCYGATLDFSDAAVYNKAATLDYLEPLEAEHITYTLIYNAGKWDVTALVYAGGEPDE